jgi:hypothetical protein
MGFGLIVADVDGREPIARTLTVGTFCGDAFQGFRGILLGAIIFAKAGDTADHQGVGSM